MDPNFEEVVAPLYSTLLCTSIPPRSMFATHSESIWGILPPNNCPPPIFSQEPCLIKTISATKNLLNTRREIRLSRFAAKKQKWILNNTAIAGRLAQYKIKGTFHQTKLSFQTRKDSVAVFDWRQSYFSCGNNFRFSFYITPEQNF